MKDFNNKELNIGDKVVFIATDQNKHRLKKGTVKAFENKYKLRDARTKVMKV